MATEWDYKRWHEVVKSAGAMQKDAVRQSMRKACLQLLSRTVSLCIGWQCVDSSFDPRTQKMCDMWWNQEAYLRRSEGTPIVGMLVLSEVICNRNDELSREGEDEANIQSFFWGTASTNKHSAKNKTRRKQRKNPPMLTENDRLQSRDNIGDPTDLTSLWLFGL